MSPRVLASALAALIMLGFSASPARAHLGSTKYLYVEVPASTGATASEPAPTLQVMASIETVDVAMQLGLGEEAPVGAVLQRHDQIAAWLLGGVTLRRGGVVCPGQVGAPRETARDQRSFIDVDLTFRCATPAGEGDLVLRDDTVFPDDRQHEALVYVGGGRESATVLRAGHRELVLTGPPPATWELGGAFLWEGMLHFALGYDHVLFLLSLLLGVGLLRHPSGEARAPVGPSEVKAPSPHRALLAQLAWLVTAFTVGHSVTLALAALEVVVLPSQPVEVAIAASIVAVAVHTALAPQRRGGLPLVAGGFGLIHGFGFSSVLRELGLPAGDTVLALVAFNVGIELAQLAFVALVLGPLLRLGRTPWYEPVVVRGGSVVIALMASYWVVERVLG
ncbi:MAG: HupE/UreJ family protein [Polyangiales bacterium]